MRRLAPIGRLGSALRHLPRDVLGGRWGLFSCRLVLYSSAMAAAESCVATTGDLDRIHKRIEAGEERIEAALAGFESGLIDAEEVTGAIRSAWGDNKAEVARVARDVTERGGVAWDTIIYAVTAAASVCVPGSVVLTNRMRDSRRARRNEPVAVAPSKGKVS